MRYLVTPELLTFVSKEGETLTLNKGNPYFTTIRSLLEENKEWSNEVMESIQLTRSKLLEEISDAFHTVNGKVYYKDRVLSSSFSDIVIEYLDEDIPLVPLSNLLENLHNVDEDKALFTMELVAKGVLPITYTGNLIGYKRQSWVNEGFNNVNSYEEYRQKVFNSVYNPGDYVSHPNGLTLGTLQWAGKFCPDQGSLQEVVFEPSSMLDIISLSEDKPFLVNQYMFLGNIPEYQKHESRGKVVFIMQTNKVGSKGNMIIRKPYSLETIREYFNTLISRTPSNNSFPIGKEIEVQFEEVSACLN